MSQLVTNHKTHLVLVHKGKEGRIDIHNVRLVLMLGSPGTGIDAGIARHIEIYRLMEIKRILHFLAQRVEIPKDLLINLHTVSFHLTPVNILGHGVINVIEDEADDVSLKGIVYLLGKLFLLPNLIF